MASPEHDGGVTDLLWDEVQGWFDPAYNGTAPDGIVRDTTVEDWNRIVALAAQHGWPTQFHADDREQPVPADLAPYFRAEHHELAVPVAVGSVQPYHLTWLTVWPRPATAAIFRLWAPGSIDFDFDLYAVQDQAGLDWLGDFMRTLGQAVGRRVEVMPEGYDQKPFLVYDPFTDRLDLVRRL
jgi:hypothetical protein